ncbi:MAG: hypothetical protein WCX31_18870 [Salinivirgaceae bacterium]|jgi:hypothetical protein
METPQLIGGFKQKFEKFVYLYKKTKEENNHLIIDNQNLNKLIIDKNNEIEELKHRLKTKDLAKTFLASEGNEQEAKVKINRIVREIDNCIALLNR